MDESQKMEIARQVQDGLAEKNKLGALGVGTVLVGVYFLGRRWINRHYDNRRLQIIRETKDK